VFLEELVEVFLEKFGATEGFKALVVAADDGVEFGDEGAGGVAAEVVVEAFEFTEGNAVEGAGGLVAEVGGVGVGRGRDGGDEVHEHQAGDALVEDLGGDFETFAELGGGAGREAGLEAASDQEENDEGEALAHGFGEAAPGGLAVAEMDVLNGVADLSAEEDEEPEDVEAEHEDRQETEGAVEAFLEDDALEVEEREEVVEDDEGGDDEGADEGGTPPDVGIGNGAVENREHRDQHEQGAGGEGEFQEGDDLGAVGHAGFKGVEERAGGESGEGGKEEDGAEGEDGPVEDDAHDPGTTAADAPDLVEGRFDGGEQLEDYDDERDGADGADGAVLGAGDEAVDHLEQLRVFGGGGGGDLGGGGDDAGTGGVGGRGEFAGFFEMFYLRGDFLDDVAQGLSGEVGVLLVEHEAGDEHGDGDERAEAE